MIREPGRGDAVDLRILARATSLQRQTHVQLLDQFLKVLPHILPPAETLRPVLLHHDLHSDNIFVDSTDPPRITGIIDWQAVYTAPLFMQAKFPSVFDSEDPYPWGAVQPQLPTDFESLSESEKESANAKLSRLRLKKFYELASRKFNPHLIKAMDAMRNEDDPTAFIFQIVGRTSKDGPVPLRELLIQIYEKWDQLMARREVDSVSCPISFSDEEISASRQQAEAWAEAYGEYEAVRAQLAGDDDGWVSHDEYDVAWSRWEAHRETLELLRKRLEELS